MGASPGSAELYEGGERLQTAQSAAAAEVLSQEAPAAEEDKNVVGTEKDRRELQLSGEAQRAMARGIPTMPPLSERQHHRLLH